ncbi:MAG: Bacteriohemerythrin [uncultured Sulfurimonas sp.]|nr:MAG: Bacteriohemerythrin [uncultured Sulfurimonas sp.]CAI6161252.1 MAG: Bacteriohemerythrin [uncultured Sulfurimonas sp.]
MGLIYVEQVEEMDVEEMQATHENEIQILNDIDKLATHCQIQKTPTDALEAKLHEYVKHVHKHFANEEHLMQKYNFPKYEMHKTAHDIFLSDLEHSSREWRKYGDLKKILNFVRKTPEWIVLHVNSVDAPTAVYLNQRMQED